MMRVVTLLLAAVAVTSCVPRTAQYKSEACVADEDCELMVPCCACCKEVPMTRVDAQTERDRCTTVECRTECEAECPPSNRKAACVNGECSTVPR